jgi:methionyl-tRNA formyltransferase
MKIVFLGATKFSEDILLYLLENKISIDLLFTIPREFNISYSKEKVVNYNFSDIISIAKQYNINCYEIESKEGGRITDYYDNIKALDPDVILVMGWYYMVPKKIRDLAKLGTWGIHASLLPDYAGGAPLVWAIIEGQKKTGVTLFKLDDGVDDGDIIEQAEIEIKQDDTIKEVYEEATRVSKVILLHALKNIDKIKFIPQDKSKIKVYPQRKPDDGQIDLNMPGQKMYDFIRAQTPPYPGAFIKTIDGKKIVVEKARLIE